MNEFLHQLNVEKMIFGAWALRCFTERQFHLLTSFCLVATGTF